MHVHVTFASLVVNPSDPVVQIVNHTAHQHHGLRGWTKHNLSHMCPRRVRGNRKVYQRFVLAMSVTNMPFFLVEAHLVPRPHSRLGFMCILRRSRQRPARQHDVQTVPRSLELSAGHSTEGGSHKRLALSSELPAERSAERDSRISRRSFAERPEVVESPR